ncbi:unnamed protein product [Peniophora sp. CBMAI 1063]|nr:unnamed protein product [Peniophora sp. CBMAI 1063]
MNAVAAASIILFIVVAAAICALALQLYAARKLSWAWTGRRRSRYTFAFVLSIALALLAGATATLGVLVWLQGGRVLGVAHDVCSICAQLLAGSIALFLLQQRSFVQTLSLCCSLFTPTCLRLVGLLIALPLLVGTGWAIADTFTDVTALKHIPTYLIISFLGPALLLSVAHALAPPVYDERHYQAMWITLALSQAAGIVDIVFSMVLAEQLVLQSWMTVAWFVGTLAALHIYTTLEPLAPSESGTEGAVALPITPRIIVHKERFLSPAYSSGPGLSDADNSRVHKPESPITPTELYMYTNDPFASPPASISMHSHHDSFEDFAFRQEQPPSRTPTHPSRKRSARHHSEPVIPTLSIPIPKHRERRPSPSILRNPHSLTLDVRLSEVSTLVGSHKG